MINDVGEKKKWGSELKEFGRMPMMSSPAGEYFVDWKTGWIL
jgi:hypothetical protein